MIDLNRMFQWLSTDNYWNLGKVITRQESFGTSQTYYLAFCFHMHSSCAHRRGFKEGGFRVQLKTEINGALAQLGER